MFSCYHAVKATDSRPNNEIEKSIREHIEWPVDKDLAREIRLPFPTEWVLIKQSYILKIRVEIQKRKGKEEMDTGLLLSMPKFRSDDFPKGLKLQNGKVVKTKYR